MAACGSNKPKVTIATAEVKKQSTLPDSLIDVLLDKRMVKDTLFESTHFTFINQSPDVDLVRLQQMGKTCEQMLVRIEAFAGQIFEDKIKYILYASGEEKGLISGDTRHAHVDANQPIVHAIVNEKYDNNFLHYENIVVLRKLLGTPKYEALEKGLAIHFTEQWQKKTYQDWTSLLFHSNNMYTLEDLFDNQKFKNGNDLVLEAYAGVLTDFLIEQEGKEKFLENYNRFSPDKAWLSEQEEKWLAYLNQLEKVDLPEKNKTLPYLEGFNFAHEGYQIFNGYISKMAIQSLIQLHTLGADAIAIVPYSYMRKADQPSVIPVVERAGTENDESVIHSAYMAKKMGMTTVLKPQIWLGRSWPGDVNMKSDAEWESFFQYYHDWIIHYAMLAEIHDIDLFCIGVEFVQATLQNEDQWRKLIRQIRGVYSGPIVYAANWGDEFEQLRFWDDLDYIGVNCYYPLSKKANPSEEELKKGFEQALYKIRKVQAKFNKPVLFTEIGFRSVAETWTEPHAAAKGRAIDKAGQKLCYEVVFEALENEPWCHGILWWKWPTNTAHQWKKGDGFTPYGKEAEAVVDRFFD